MRSSEQMFSKELCKKKKKGYNNAYNFNYFL